MMKPFSLIFVVCMLLLCIPAYSGELSGYGNVDTVVINSRDWKTVYYGMLLAEYIDADPFFLQTGATPAYITRNIQGDVLLIEDDPIISAVRSIISANDLVLKEYDFDGGIEMAGRIGLDKVIVVNPSYGYDSVSVIPYALLTRSFVVFSDEDMDGLDDFDLLFYGEIPESVTSRYDALETIDLGGRYENNIGIVDMFLEERQVRQAVLTSGEFLEDSLFNERYPIIFVGKGNVPISIEKYIAASDIAIVTLVGNELASHVSDFKSRLDSIYGKEISVILLLGKSNVAQGERRENQIMALDTYPIPMIYPSLTITRVIYNDITRSFEVTIRNENELKVYFLTSLEFLDRAVGDDSIQSIEGGRTRTLQYVADVGIRQFSGTAKVVYGIEERSLDNLAMLEFDPIERLEIADESEIKIDSVEYDRFNKAFKVSILNTGDVPAYVDIELADIRILGERRTLTSENPMRVDVGEEKNVIIRADLSPLDIEENGNVLVRAYYGQREGILLKMIEEDFLLILTASYALYAGIALLIIIIAVLLFIMLRRRSKGRQSFS